MSESTIISILPKVNPNANTVTTERKPGVHPGEYIIEGADLLKDPFDFKLTYVQDAYTPIYIGYERGSIQVRLLSIEIAKSIVRDYLDAKIENSPDAHPGLFCVEGRKTRDEINIDYATELKDARTKQLRWFEKLVYRADDDWNRYHNHKMISDEQRYAAKFMNLTRDWIVEIVTEGMVNCPACQTRVSSMASICPACRTVINQEAYSKLKGAIPQAVTK